ncbi:MAG: hypothetical protein OEZ58_18650 [Gammaproteobacteria bacterium]|nr:hypothetical protein [Gammaproteobacteria bacterium]
MSTQFFASKIRPVLFIWALMLVWPTFVMGEYRSINTEFLLTIEDLTLPKSESMGLLGGQYLYKLQPRFALGLGIYGAMTGKRGGFFTGGLESRFSYPMISQFNLDLGGFIGGGGGGAAPQGGGLMLRYYSQVKYDIFDNTSLAFGISKIDFPNGEISSLQYFLAYQQRFLTWYEPGWSTKISKPISNASKTISWMTRNFQIRQTGYFPSRYLKKTNGDVYAPNLQIIGVAWQQYNYQRQLFYELETGGAWSGGIDGFAQVFFGLGRYFAISDYLGLKIRLALGSAGGGGVDTGGGALFRASIGLDKLIKHNFTLGLMLAYTSSIDGAFRLPSIQFSVGRHYALVNNIDSAQQLAALKDSQKQLLRIRAAWQRYLMTGEQARKGNKEFAEQGVDLFSLKLDSFFNRNWYLSGQAHGAFNGGAGGYAVGLLGVGFMWTTVVMSPAIEMNLGAAGGGGLNVGTGLVAQPMLSLSYALSKTLAVETGLGYFLSLNGGLVTPVFNLGLEYRFAVSRGLNIASQ